MTKKFYFFIFIFISLNLNAQVDFKGVWQGVIMMYGQSMEKANTFYLNIETNGKASEGKTREEVVNSPYYCIKKTSYSSKNNELKLSQKLITKKKSSSRTTWCLFNANLTYNDSTGYLEGTFISTKCRNYGGKIIMYRSNATFSESEILVLPQGWIKTFQKDLNVGLNAPEIRIKERSEFVFEPIYFDYDKDELKPEYEAFLMRMIKVVNGHPDLRVQVTGNTDSDGSDEYNIDLSKRRAEAIIHFFENQGITVDRLIINFKGESNPIDTNSTPEGKQRNRRVDFAFIYE